MRTISALAASRSAGSISFPAIAITVAGCASPISPPMRSSEIPSIIPRDTPTRRFEIRDMNSSPRSSRAVRRIPRERQTRSSKCGLRQSSSRPARSSRIIWAAIPFRFSMAADSEMPSVTWVGKLINSPFRFAALAVQPTNGQAELGDRVGELLDSTPIL